MHFRWIFCSDACRFHIFAKMCSPLQPEAHFWKPTLSKMPWNMLVLNHFWVHWPFQPPSVGPSYAIKNQKKCCSREGLEHFFDLRPFFNHNLQFIFAISVTCFKKFDVWCLLACFFFIFFASFMKMCSPPSVGSTFPKNSFCNYRVQEAVSIPKLASKPPLMGGHFRLVLCKK